MLETTEQERAGWLKLPSKDAAHGWPTSVPMADTQRLCRDVNTLKADAEMLKACLKTASLTLHDVWAHEGRWDDCPMASCHGDAALVGALREPQTPAATGEE